MTHIDHTPLKWTKYLILASFGFVSRAELERDIKRYKRSQRRLVIRDVLADLRVEQQASHRNLYVIKLVSIGLSWKLPNFRIETVADLDGLGEFFNDHEGTDYVEIWFCRTRIDDNVFSVAGRFVFTDRDNSHEQSVEQVWRCSPRLLETYSAGFRYPYLRASRYSWGWRYVIENIHIPPQLDLKPTALIDDFLLSMRLFESERERIDSFLSFLSVFRFPAYSLEYKIVENRVTIIDWDTPNDNTVVSRREDFYISASSEESVGIDRPEATGRFSSRTGCRPDLILGR